MYFRGYETLTHNCLFNFVIGNRGAGKTYWSKEWAIKNFLKDGSQFIYLRRYKQELKKNKQFFNDILDLFPDTEFDVKGTTFYINKKEAGFAMPLSTSKIEKSTTFPNVKRIIFDEFIIDKGVYRYLTDEVVMFLEFYETIARTRNVTVFFLSNATTTVNPYFLYFDLKLPYGSLLTKKNDMLLQLVQDQDFIDMKKATRFGKIIQGTKYAEYAIENKFLRDNQDFIKKKTGNCSYYFTMKYRGELIGVWANFGEGVIYISDDVDDSCRYVYSITMEDHAPNLTLIKNISKSNRLKVFVEQFKNGLVCFETTKVKILTYEIIKILNGV